MEKINKESFLKLYEQYTDSLFRHAYFRLFQREIAKDLVQETFIKTWIYISEGKKINHIKPFLYRVLHNLIIDTYKKKKEQSLDEMIEKGFTPKNEASTSPMQNQNTDAKWIQEILSHTEDPYRQIIQLRYIDELSINEIAIILNISVNVVSVRLFRGKRKLKKIISQMHIQAEI